MAKSYITSSTLEFLQALKEHNNREWFQANKAWYLQELEQVKAFTQLLRERMEAYDLIERHKLYRIYRDVRFRKDKTPYKTAWWGYLRRQKPQLRGGYFFSIRPGGSTAEGGFFGPNSDDLKLIRNKLTWDHEEFKMVLEEPHFKQVYGELQGDKVKTAPRGFAIDSPGIEYIRHKQFYVVKTFTDEEVLSTGFLDHMVDTLCTLRPFFDYMTDLLTTDLNGTSLLEEG